ncbi:TPA: hypothetical protein ACGBG5_003455 [Enterococcus faecalis]|uniref:hypothetical protein n=1 Tax=Enterococcus faecalis TaxID=1351 RepID=UPI0036D72A45
MSFTAFIERYQKFYRRKGYDFQPNKPAQIYEESKELVAILPKDRMTKTLIMQAIEQLRLQMAQLTEYHVIMAMKGVRTSKRGSAQLRKTLFQVMNVLVKSSTEDEPVYMFISRKRA